MSLDKPGMVLERLIGARGWVEMDPDRAGVGLVRIIDLMAWLVVGLRLHRISRGTRPTQSLGTVKI